MTDVPVKRALLSVSDKTGLIDLGKALATSSVRSALAVLGVEAISSTPEQFGAFMASETERWGKLIREAGLETQRK